MRRISGLLVVVFVTLAALPAMAQQTIGATPVAGGATYGTLRPGALLFDQGPASGSNGGCWWNQQIGQNFADQATFADPVEVTEIRVFTCAGPVASTAHVKILSDDGAGNPAGVVYAEDKAVDAWLPDPASGGYVVSVVLTTPFQASAGTTYWYGLSSNGDSPMNQFSVLTPGDGTMAQFEGLVFQFHAGVGDQMFQLMGTVVPVELQSIDIE
jgi:hypothetical protein